MRLPETPAGSGKPLDPGNRPRVRGVGVWVCVALPSDGLAFEGFRHRFTGHGLDEAVLEGDAPQLELTDWPATLNHTLAERFTDVEPVRGNDVKGSEIPLMSHPLH